MRSINFLSTLINSVKKDHEKNRYLSILDRQWTDNGPTMARQRPDNDLTNSRLDSVSFACRCRVLDNPRYISAAFPTRVWKHVAMIFAVLVMSIANIGMAWGANTPATAGTYTLTSSNKPNNENKFYKLGNGVYIHRRNNSSQDDNGLKAKNNNTNGIAVYVNSSMNLSCSIYKASSKAAQTVGINVYTLSNGSTTFDSFESGTDNSTTVSVTLSASATYTTSVSFAATGSNTTETKSSSNITLAAGYYYIVPAETTSEGKTYLKSITLAAAGCSSYSFHYGNDGDASNLWTIECFVAQGDEHEMQVEDFTIPSKTHFYVGKNSEFHGTSGNAGDANSVTTTWSSMYFATSIGDGTGTRPMLGQATGATGTIRIYDNSTWNNKQAAFIPDGYKLKVGSTEYAFAVEAGNEYRSDIVELSSSNARSNISVGITNSSGNYVATDNTQEMQHVFLDVTTKWGVDNAKFVLYDVTNSSFTCAMVQVPGNSNLYEGWVPSNCATVIFVRRGDNTLSFTDKWNQTGDLTLESGKNYFTITDWGAGTWSTYEKKGKFRMNADWVDKNWYVRFNPYHVLTYNANGGSGAPAAQSVAVDAVPCQWTLSTTQPTWADHVFLGWSTNSSASIPDAASEVADLGTPYPATGDVTLYAVWSACIGPNVTAALGTSGVTDGSHHIGDALGTLTCTASATNGGALTYAWKQYDGAAIGSATAAAGATNSATYSIPNDVACTDRHYFCEVTEAGCSVVNSSNPSGALTLTANTPILSWALATNTSSWTATPTNNDATNLTNVATSTDHADIQSGNASGKTCKISLSSSATPDKYVTFTFKVACGKKLTPSSVWMEVANVGGSSDGKMTHKAEMSDNFGHSLNATVTPASDGVLNELNITNGSGTYFQGVVTLKVWAWNSTSGGDGSAFRMGPNVKIFGEIASQATPAATITWDTHPASGTVGDADATIAAHASDGSTITYTSNDVAVATIVAGKVRYVGAGTTTIQASITDQCGNTVNQNSNSFTVTVPTTYTLTVSGAAVDNPMTSAGKTGAISGVTITGSPVSGITSGTTTATSDNTFTVNKGTPETVTASASVSGSSAECDECTYVFDHWTNVPATVTADVSTIEAVYKTTYTISFKETDGTAVAGISSSSYEYGVGKLASSLPTPTKSGYTFDGWYKENTLTNPATNIANDAWGNVTYYAKWTEAVVTYSVTYNGNGNSGGSVPTDATAYDAGDIVTVKGNTGSLTKTGYVFRGWNTASDNTGTFYPADYQFEMPASNVTLYAVWGTGRACVTITHWGTSNATTEAWAGSIAEENKYKLAHSGSNTSNNKSTDSNASIILYYGTTMSIYDSPSETTGFTNVTSVSFKVKLYNASKKPTITVSVGSGEGETVTLTDNTDNSTFKTYIVDFATPQSGAVKFRNNGSGDSGYKVYLDDIEICTGSGSSGYTVTFDNNGEGTYSRTIENVPSGSMIGEPIPAPTADGSTFGGWYKETGCTNAWNFATDVVSSDKTLYAKWTNCKPVISAQPSENTYVQNAAATALSVTASGADSYQWYSNDENNATTGSPIEGATLATYTPETGVLGTTYYYCIVSNACGSETSKVVAIVVNDGKETPCAEWTIAEPTHGGKGFTFSVVAKQHDCSTLWDGTLTTAMLTASEDVILSGVTVDNTTKTISGTYGVKASAESPVTFYLSLPATTSQSAATLSSNRTFTACASSDGDSYNIRVRKTAAHVNNYYYWDNTDGWISPNIQNSISSEKSGTTMATVFDSVYNSNTQYVWVRTYHANIKKVRIYAQFRSAGMTVNQVYKHTDFFTAADKYRVGYSVEYNGNPSATKLGDANAFEYVDITLDDALAANDVLLVKFNCGKARPLGAVLTTISDGGNQTTSLAWSNSQANGATVEKSEDAADFSITATRSNSAAEASLGAISYSSSNTAIATVNATTGQVHIADDIDFGSDSYKTTTITATLAASGCYKKATITYILQVNKFVCSEAAGTVSVKTDNGCLGKVLTVTGFEAGASFQWQKNGEDISLANSQDYTATTTGEYSVVTTKTCAVASTNSISVSFETASATKIVDEWYVKNGRRTPDIALVQTTNATDYSITSGGTPLDNIGGCKFYLGDDGIIYLKGTKDDGSAPSGLTAGDMTITITATACGSSGALDITIHKQEQRGDEKPEVAFVVDGTEGGEVNAVTDAKTTGRAIWTYLSAYYHLTGCNVYWSVDSKEIRQYYSQFDAILITDDPNTQTKGAGDVSYVKAFGTMVDVRPVLTLEAYVGRFSDGGWHVYDATPTSPNPRQVEMKLECKNHDIFAGLDPSTMANVRTETIKGDEYWYVTMVDTTLSPYHNTKDDYEKLPALQGFDPSAYSNMLGVGTIKNDELQAGVERQEEPAARMMILGVQNNAMAALTTEGKMVIKNAIDYLLKTDMEDVNDCANYFLGTTNNQWNVASNWSRGEIPDFETRARILRPVVVPNDYSTRVARVDIASSGNSKKLSGEECTGSLTISPLGALVVNGKVSRVKAPYYGINDLMPTEVSDVAILSASGGNGTLIMDNDAGENKASVQMYSKASKGSPTTWQYIGIPHSDVSNAMRNYYDSWLYSWSPSNGWEVVPRGGAVEPWIGYCITYPTSGHTFDMEGTLVATEDVDIEVPANSYQIIGNSWVAPIQIANFEDEDFGDIAKTVYFFNTGSDTEGTGSQSNNATGAVRWNAGTYISVPIHMAEYTGEDKIIPSMQGFYVANTGAAGSLHLDYDKLVRQGGVANYIQGQMHAPKHDKQVRRAEDEPLMLKIVVKGSRYDDRLIVAEREDFTKGNDDGWDGEKWDGSTVSPTIWSQNKDGGVEAVTATPDMEGTMIGFRAGEDSEYTFYFEYDEMAEALYLLDTDNSIYTRILIGATYTFTCADKGEHNRFILTRNAPEVITGCENVDGSGGVKATKFIKDNKMYILLNGVLYDATGKVVK